MKLVWILLSTSTMSDYAELWSRLESLVGGGLVGCPFLPPPGVQEAGFSNDIKFAQETDCDGDGNSSSSLPGIMCKIKFS